MLDLGWKAATNCKFTIKKMHESKKEKYLGDTINRTGSQRATIQDRKQKGFGIIGQIIAIIKEAFKRA